MADASQEPTKKARAFGRSIGDFKKLNNAEETVVEKAAQGMTTVFGEKIPTTREERAARIVRAELVRFLALGGDEQTPVHERGVRIQGAVISGDLDLAGCKLAGDLNLWNCELAGALTLRSARTRSVNLNGSKCQAIEASSIRASGGVYMRNGFVATGLVTLLVARISGDLSCVGGRLEGRDVDGNALVCDRIEIGGGVFLRDNFIAIGAVRLSGAKIGGNLDCSGGHFRGRNADGISLDCDGAEIGGGAFVDYGFVAASSVTFANARINGDLICNGGAFGTARQAARDAERGSPERPFQDILPMLSLDLSRSLILGTLWLGGLRKEAAIFHGDISLVGASIRRIVDAVIADTRRREPGPSADKVSMHLMLDGLTYDRFGEPTNVAGSARIAFLELQREDDLGEKFKSQPWVQMVKVLREMGHTEAARQVAVAFEDRWRQAGHYKGLLVPLHWLYGKFVGYGHRPMRLLAIMICVWFACGLLYQNAAQQGWFAPTHAAYFQNPRYQSCRPENGGNWVKCTGAPEYTTFNALTYSLDLIVPFVDLQQDKDWAPMVDKGPLKPGEKASPFTFGAVVRFFMWFEILFGWMASALLAAVLTGLAKRVE